MKSQVTETHLYIVKSRHVAIVRRWSVNEKNIKEADTSSSVRHETVCINSKKPHSTPLITSRTNQKLLSDGRRLCVCVSHLLFFVCLSTSKFQVGERVPYAHDIVDEIEMNGKTAATKQQLTSEL